MIVDHAFGPGYAEASWPQFWLARQLLFERVFGPAIRANEREERRKEAGLASDYAKSVELLKRQQQV